LDDIDLLPQVLREQSLSQREIVLPYRQALEALWVLMTARWALLGWEGWVKYPDGRHGPTPGGVMGADVARKEGETWADYVHRSARLCRETMTREQQAWEANREYAHLVLCFCLTATPPEG
jgi:hypothetical protein